MEITEANPFHPDKLLLHQAKVAALADGTMIAPQTIEVDLTDGACNQGCVYCCFSSGEGKKMVRIDRIALLQTLREAYALGTRAVELVGGGEPTAHPEIAGIVNDILEIGAGDMEVGLITNGLLAERILPVAEYMRFVRISLDTALSATYQVLHKVPARQFDKVLTNIRRLREAMPKIHNARQLGIGYLVVPPYNHQAEEVMAGTKLAHELGVDYITYRPVELTNEQPQEYWQEAQRAIGTARRHLREISSHTVVFGGVGNRWDTLRPGGHPTGICDAKPLVAVIQANGDVAHCILYRNKREMRIGNIHQGSFADQWFSNEHQQAWQSRQVDGCPNPCKLYRYNEVVRSARNEGVGSAPPYGDVAHHLFV
jgi:radical SAM protein with 4Fe4S-binding SPASM domain